MKAVNLIPEDSRKSRQASTGLPQGPGVIVVAILVLALAFATIDVLTSNTISARQAKLAALKTEVSAEHATSTRLTGYAQFAKLAQSRLGTVRQILAARFDWHGALSDLSRAVPATSDLTGLNGTVVPGASTTGSGAGGSASSLVSDETGPSLVLSGCSRNQDDVARLMSRLRAMRDVTRVTLSNSVASGSSTGSSGSSGSSSTSQGGCTGSAPAFSLVVFYTPVPGAGADGLTSSAASATTSGATG